MSTEELAVAASTIWVVVAAVFVMFMQAGFAFGESEYIGIRMQAERLRCE